jgi:hypothetical protein
MTEGMLFDAGKMPALLFIDARLTQNDAFYLDR